MNIFKITPKGEDNILWLIGSLCDFVVHRNSFFVHTEMTATALKRRIRKEGYEVTIQEINGKDDNYPSIIEVWAINDGSKKALAYVKENKEDISAKILSYVLEGIEDILKDVKDMKGG